MSSTPVAYYEQKFAKGSVVFNFISSDGVRMSDPEEFIDRFSDEELFLTDEAEINVFTVRGEVSDPPGDIYSAVVVYVGQQVHSLYRYTHGVLGTDLDSPSVVMFGARGQVIYEEWRNSRGEVHREKMPAIIAGDDGWLTFSWWENGRKISCKTHIKDSGDLTVSFNTGTKVM